MGFDIFNEAQNYTLLSGPAGIDYRVYVGYADNVHTGACGGGATLLGLNGSSTCFPEVFNTSTYQDFAPGFLPAIPLPSIRLPNHCLEFAATATCFEGGVIRIVCWVGSCDCAGAGHAADGRKRWHAARPPVPTRQADARVIRAAPILRRRQARQASHA